jgi:hypothetical protein
MRIVTRSGSRCAFGTGRRPRPGPCWRAAQPTRRRRWAKPRPSSSVRLDHGDASSLRGTCEQCSGLAAAQRRVYLGEQSNSPRSARPRTGRLNPGGSIGQRPPPHQARPQHIDRRARRRRRARTRAMRTSKVRIEQSDDSPLMIAGPVAGDRRARLARKRDMAGGMRPHGRGRARAQWRLRAMSPGALTTSRMVIRSPHLRQTASARDWSITTSWRLRGAGAVGRVRRVEGVSCAIA